MARSPYDATQGVTRLALTVALAIATLVALVMVVAGHAAVSSPPASSPPASGGPRSVARVTAATQAVTDAQGQQWLPSPGWSGGHVDHTDAAISGTASPALYQTRRDEARGLTVAVPGSGTYAVAVYFADTTSTRAGQRVFDVVADGSTAARSVDSFARVGRSSADHLLFTVAVGTSDLTLRFDATAGRTAISAVEVGYVGPNQAGHVAWCDDFDGPAGQPVDPTRWGHDVGGGGWGNGELQTYTDDPANAHTDGAGHLDLVAERTPGASGDAYTSARLTTAGKAAFRYGRISVRARLPIGKGLWPAFWALGTDIDRVGYPESGELDVMENSGQGGTVSGTVHGPEGPEGRGTSSLGGSATTSFGGTLATYAMLWTPIGISFSINGQTYEVAVPADLPASSPWVFDKPFSLVLNLAIGGTFPGPPGPGTAFPAVMEVDQVRVVQW